ncbi:O-antigen ligase family protein [Mycobacterium sp. 236(2023)]|uniref:O-antigen ligase family protein n=1 Tax=Mycobacterium sp. 236(2023) TaxID=3038163 RepID=UPI0024155E89|nr:O-antigen ligase family protein [Mycobacterium sp. 236(2023)]MDG4664231.1 O-antigen ligase family protein [Mycobacterium sp. 236(2023)]
MGAGVSALLLVINLMMPHRMRLIGVALLTVPQFYLPGMPLPLATIWTVITCIVGLLDRDRTPADSRLVTLIGLFVCVTAVSLLWATSSGIRPGIVTVTYALVFLLWLREMIVLARNTPELIDTFVIWMVPGVMLQSFLVILFRVSPTLEERFLRSQAAAITVGPTASRLYTDLGNNVLDVSKSGGLLVNGNVASLFGGVAGLLLCVAARRTGHRLLFLCAGISLAGSLFTGSKSAILVGTCCAISVIIFPHMRRGSAIQFALPALLTMPLAYLVASDIVQRIAPSFYAASDSSYDTRQLLWARAASMFREHPILGPGFGGWTEQVGRIGSHYNLPPHNYVIAAWAYSGIVAALIAIAFVAASLAFGFRVAVAQPSLRDRRTAILALCALAWVFFHGMADNTPFYGDRLTMILFAAALSYLYVIASPFEQDASGGTVSNAGSTAHSSLLRRPPPLKIASTRKIG